MPHIIELAWGNRKSFLPRGVWGRLYCTWCTWGSCAACPHPWDHGRWDSRSTRGCVCFSGFLCAAWSTVRPGKGNKERNYQHKFAKHRGFRKMCFLSFGHKIHLAPVPIKASGWFGTVIPARKWKQLIWNRWAPDRNFPMRSFQPIPQGVSLEPEEKAKQSASSNQRPYSA